MNRSVTSEFTLTTIDLDEALRIGAAAGKVSAEADDVRAAAVRVAGGAR